MADRSQLMQSFFNNTRKQFGSQELPQEQVAAPAQPKINPEFPQIAPKGPQFPQDTQEALAKMAGMQTQEAPMLPPSMQEQQAPAQESYSAVGDDDRQRKMVALKNLAGL